MNNKKNYFLLLYFLFLSLGGCSSLSNNSSSDTVNKNHLASFSENNILEEGIIKLNIDANDTYVQHDLPISVQSFSTPISIESTSVVDIESSIQIPVVEANAYTTDLWVGLLGSLDFSIYYNDILSIDTLSLQIWIENSGLNGIIDDNYSMPVKFSIGENTFNYIAEPTTVNVFSTDTVINEILSMEIACKFFNLPAQPYQGELHYRLIASSQTEPEQNIIASISLKNRETGEYITGEATILRTPASYSGPFEIIDTVQLGAEKNDIEFNNGDYSGFYQIIIDIENYYPVLGNFSTNSNPISNTNLLTPISDENNSNRTSKSFTMYCYEEEEFGGIIETESAVEMLLIANPSRELLYQGSVHNRDIITVNIPEGTYQITEYVWADGYLGSISQRSVNSGSISTTLRENK
jgi:hypothetical protein